MVLIQISVPWLREEHLERPLEITKVNEVKGKFGPEIELEAKCGSDTVRFSCYGKNKNFMVYQFGADTEAWIGKIIIVGLVQQEWKGTLKEMRVFRVPK